MGGSSTTATPVKSSTTATQTLSPEQKQLMDLAMPAITDIAKNPPQLYPGSTVAPMDPTQVRAQNMALGATGGIDALNTSTGAGIGGLISGGATGGASQTAGMNFLSNPNILDPSTNPHLSAAIQAAISPVTQNFTNSVLPNIRGGAISSGQFGGSRQGVVEANAGQDYMHEIGGIASTMANQNYQSGLGAMVSGIGLNNQSNSIQNQATATGLGFAPQQLASMLAPAQITGAVGDARQAQTQAQLTEAAQRFMAEQMMPFSVAQDIAGLAYAHPSGTTTTNSTGTSVTPKSSPMQGVATGLGAVASIAAIF